MTVIPSPGAPVQNIADNPALKAINAVLLPAFVTAFIGFSGWVALTLISHGTTLERVDTTVAYQTKVLDKHSDAIDEQKRAVANAETAASDAAKATAVLGKTIDRIENGLDKGRAEREGQLKEIGAKFDVITNKITTLDTRLGDDERGHTGSH